MLDNTFYIKTKYFPYLVQLLQNLSNTIPTKEEPPVRLFQREDNISGNIPDLLYIYKNENGWYGVDHNVSEPLYDWGAFLSAKLNAQFIQIAHYCEEKFTFLAKENAEFSYFLFFDCGQKKREIKVWSNEPAPLLDEGNKLSFESPFIHYPQLLNEEVDPEIYNCNIYGFFNEDSLVDYCQQFGIDPDFADDTEYFVLKKFPDQPYKWSKFLSPEK